MPLPGGVRLPSGPTLNSHDSTGGGKAVEGQTFAGRSIVNSYELVWGGSAGIVCGVKRKTPERDRRLASLSHTKRRTVQVHSA